MKKRVKRLSGSLMVMLLLASIMLPVSASASPSQSAAYQSSTATSFLSSLLGAIGSLFHKDTPPANNPPQNQQPSGINWSDWLKGNNCGNGWWGDTKNDSYKIWEKYYCY
ncbi:hypothetical protein F4V43_17575 [Paenibacillus spiritus]|uniref:Uncharacterized protein n=1 Tax=Paenibacillus spiritus TaxID=2496557 RepID=A0A5J5FVI9_9BACL|nr:MULTISPECIES: hypothetical protein [Paenibacillus]KAA8997571.1 hypothetical protein F4V43_17575 [Paenibacillus spiritus]